MATTRDKKVPNLFFGTKIPKFHFGFGSSKQPKKDASISSTSNKDTTLKNVSDQLKTLSPKQDRNLSEAKKPSPNLSVRSSSKFSSNSPEIEKLRKNFLNEKRRIESFSVTTSKIPILRAKIFDSSAATATVTSTSKNEKMFEPICAKKFECSNETTTSQQRLPPPPQRSQFFDIRTKSSTRAENFFRPIDSNIRDERICPKPNASMNTRDFLAAFLAEKGTTSKPPIVERGLVRERAKAFERKIELMKVESTPRKIDVLQGSMP